MAIYELQDPKTGEIYEADFPTEPTAEDFASTLKAITGQSEPAPTPQPAEPREPISTQIANPWVYISVNGVNKRVRLNEAERLQVAYTIAADQGPEVAEPAVPEPTIPVPEQVAPYKPPFVSPTMQAPAPVNAPPITVTKNLAEELAVETPEEQAVKAQKAQAEANKPVKSVSEVQAKLDKMHLTRPPETKPELPEEEAPNKALLTEINTRRAEMTQEALDRTVTEAYKTRLAGRISKDRIEQVRKELEAELPELMRQAALEADQRLVDKYGQEDITSEAAKAAAGQLASAVTFGATKRVMPTITPLDAIAATTPDEIKQDENSFYGRNHKRLVGKRVFETAVNMFASLPGLKLTGALAKYAVGKVASQAAGLIAGAEKAALVPEALAGATTIAAEGGKLAQTGKMITAGALQGTAMATAQGTLDPEARLTLPDIAKSATIFAAFPAASLLPGIGQKAVYESANKAAAISKQIGQNISVGAIVAGGDYIAARLQDKEPPTAAELAEGAVGIMLFHSLANTGAFKTPTAVYKYRAAFKEKQAGNLEGFYSNWSQAIDQELKYNATKMKGEMKGKVFNEMTPEERLKVSELDAQKTNLTTMQNWVKARMKSQQTGPAEEAPAEPRPEASTEVAKTGATAEAPPEQPQATGRAPAATSPSAPNEAPLPTPEKLAGLQGVPPAIIKEGGVSEKSPTTMTAGTETAPLPAQPPARPAGSTAQEANLSDVLDPTAELKTVAAAEPDAKKRAVMERAVTAYTDNVIPGVYSFNAIDHSITKLEERKIPYTIVMADGQNLGGANTQFGHDDANEFMKKTWGDILQREVAAAGGIMGRSSGEEFKIIFPNKTETEINTVMADISDKIEAKKKELGLDAIAHPKHGGMPTGAFGIDYGIKSVEAGKIGDAVRIADADAYKMKAKKLLEIASKLNYVIGKDGKHYEPRNIGETPGAGGVDAGGIPTETPEGPGPASEQGRGRIAGVAAEPQKIAAWPEGTDAEAATAITPDQARAIISQAETFLTSKNVTPENLAAIKVATRHGVKGADLKHQVFRLAEQVGTLLEPEADARTAGLKYVNDQLQAHTEAQLRPWAMPFSKFKQVEQQFVRAPMLFKPFGDTERGKILAATWADDYRNIAPAYTAEEAKAARLKYGERFMHRAVIEKALAAGKTVPEAVLQEYPDIYETTPLAAQRQREARTREIAGIPVEVLMEADNPRLVQRASGKPAEVKTISIYGTLPGTEAEGKAPLKVWANTKPSKTAKIIVINQRDTSRPGKVFDQPIVMLGWDTPEQAMTAFKANQPRSLSVEIGVPYVFPDQATFDTWTKTGRRDLPLDVKAYDPVKNPKYQPPVSTTHVISVDQLRRAGYPIENEPRFIRIRGAQVPEFIAKRNLVVNWRGKTPEQIQKALTAGRVILKNIDDEKVRAEVRALSNTAIIRYNAFANKIGEVIDGEAFNKADARYQADLSEFQLNDSIIDVIRTMSPEALTEYVDFSSYVAPDKMDRFFRQFFKLEQHEKLEGLKIFNTSKGVYRTKAPDTELPAVLQRRLTGVEGAAEGEEITKFGDKQYQAELISNAFNIYKSGKLRKPYFADYLKEEIDKDKAIISAQEAEDAAVEAAAEAKEKALANAESDAVPGLNEGLATPAEIDKQTPQEAADAEALAQVDEPDQFTVPDPLDVPEDKPDQAREGDLPFSLKQRVPEAERMLTRPQVIQVLDKKILSRFNLYKLGRRVQLIVSEEIPLSVGISGIPSNAEAVLIPVPPGNAILWVNAKIPAERLEYVLVHEIVSHLGLDVIMDLDPAVRGKIKAAFDAEWAWVKANSGPVIADLQRKYGNKMYDTPEFKALEARAKVFWNYRRGYEDRLRYQGEAVAYRFLRSEWAASQVERVLKEKLNAGLAKQIYDYIRALVKKLLAQVRRLVGRDGKEMNRQHFEDAVIIDVINTIKNWKGGFEGPIERARAGEGRPTISRQYSLEQMDLFAAKPAEAVPVPTLEIGKPPTDRGAYVSEEEYNKALFAQYKGGTISSREVPSTVKIPAVGSWRVNRLNGIYGHEIDQLVEMPIEMLSPHELDAEGRLDPVKRGDDIRYAQWIKEGKGYPPIDAVEMKGGKYSIVDGHRRYLAAKLAGLKTIKAWVSPSVDAPSGSVEAYTKKPIQTGLTYEIATGQPWAAGDTMPEGFPASPLRAAATTGGTAAKAAATKPRHIAIYNGKEVVVEADKPGAEFKRAAMRVHDNAQEGVVKTPAGKYFHISRSFGMAKPITAERAAEITGIKPEAAPAPAAAPTVDLFGQPINETRLAIEKYKREKAETETLATTPEVRDLPLFNKNEAARAAQAQMKLFSLADQEKNLADLGAFEVPELPANIKELEADHPERINAIYRQQVPTAQKILEKQQAFKLADGNFISKANKSELAVSGGKAWRVTTLTRDGATITGHYYLDQGEAEMLVATDIVEAEAEKYSLAKWPRFKPVDTESPEFKAWFAGSVLRTAEGQPMKYYHGTDRRFTRFEKQPDKYGEWRGGGFYFHPEEGFAEQYGKNVQPFYLKAKKVFDWQNPDQLAVAEKALKASKAYEPWMLKELRDGDWEILEMKPVQDAIMAGGYDGYYVNDHPGKAIAVYGATQIKSALKNTGEFGQMEGDFRFSLATQKAGLKAVDTNSPAFKAWFGNSKVVDATGKALRVFHGTKRPDRIGSKFLRARATSGPMAYFTDDPDIAGGYATGKQDTSIGDDYLNYEDWFKVKIPGQKNPVNISRYWWVLTPEQRQKISDLAPRISRDDNGVPELRGPEAKNGIGNYDWEIKQARGNALKALAESWLTSGAIFDEEEFFMKILQMAGTPMQGVYFDSPHAEYPSTYPVYLSIKNPLITTTIPDAVVQALDRASKYQKYQPLKARGNDAWDKFNRRPGEWIAQLKEDIQNKTTMAWTSIPDWVTKTLEGMGYDGVIDIGGKYAGITHSVYVPFRENQVKSAISNQGAYLPGKDIRMSLGETEQFGVPELPTFLRPAGLYSNLEKAITSAKFEKAPAGQWLKWLDPASGHGTKADENRETGITDWLTHKADKVLTKAEVLNVAQRNAVALSETVKGTKATEPAYTWTVEGRGPREGIVEQLFDRNKNKVIAELRNRQSSSENDKLYFAERLTSGGIILYSDTGLTLYRIPPGTALNNRDEAQNVSDEVTRQESLMQFMERKGYRYMSDSVEMVDMSEDEPKIIGNIYFGSDARNYIESMFNLNTRDFSDMETKAKWAKTQYVTPGGSDHQEILYAMPKIGERFNVPGGHAYGDIMTDRNQILRVRQADHLAHPVWSRPKEDFLVRHIDEVQSDWHEEAVNTGGFKEPIPEVKDVDPFSLIVEELPATERRLERWVIKAPEGGYTTEIFKSKKELATQNILADVANTEDQARLKAAAIIYRMKYLDRNLRIEKEMGRPAWAPWAKTWQDLAARTIILRAISEGYPVITWTTGEAQAERYRLSNYVKTLSYGPKDKELYIVKKGEGNFTSVGKMKDEQDLANYVGKDVAQKLLAAPLSQAGNHVLNVEDLKVGGQGMVNFYNPEGKSSNNFARAMSRVAKALDPAAGEIEPWIIQTEKPGAGYYAATRPGKQTEVWGIRLTPAMAEKAEAGLPMFSMATPQQKPEATKAGILTSLKMKEIFSKGQILNPDFAAGKKGDRAAAQRFYDANVNAEGVARIKQYLDPIVDKNTVLVTQPSTTRLNVVPLVMAENVAKLYGIPVINGSDVLQPTRKEEAKTVPQEERPFRQTPYIIAENAADKLSGKNIVLVDDVLSQAGSVANAHRTLSAYGYNVSGIIGGIGKESVYAEPTDNTQEFQDLVMSRGNEIVRDFNKLLTTTEMNYILSHIKGIQNEADKTEFAQRVQGLLDDRTPAAIRRFTEQQAPGRNNANTENTGGAPAGQGAGPGPGLIELSSRTPDIIPATTTQPLNSIPVTRLPWTGTAKVDTEITYGELKGGYAGALKAPILAKTDELQAAEAGQDRAKVEAIKAVIRAGKDDLPPIIVERDGNTLYIQDGHHRWQAAKEMGYDWIPVREYNKEWTLGMLSPSEATAIENTALSDIRFSLAPAGKPEIPQRGWIDFHPDGSVTIYSTYPINRSQWAKVNSFMKRKGYDWRGPDDAKRAIVGMKGDLTGDHAEAIRYALGEGKYAKTKDQELTAKVTKYFGTTADPREAGYINTNGAYIDFSGKKFGGSPGTRALDHREIGDASPEINGGTSGMREFMKAGNIRMDYPSGGMDMVMAPNEAQRKALVKFIASRQNEKDVAGGVSDFAVDLWDGLGDLRDSGDYYERPVRTFEYVYPEGARVSTILQDIDNFYAGKNIVKSDVGKWHQGEGRMSLAKGEDFGVPEIPGYPDVRYSLSEAEARMMGGAPMAHPENEAPAAVDAMYAQNLKMQKGKKKKPEKIRAEAVTAQEGTAIEKILVPISDQLFDIAPELRIRTRKYLFDLFRFRGEMRDMVLPFLKKKRAMTELDRSAYDLAEKNAWQVEIDRLNNKYDLGMEYKAKRMALDRIHVEAQRAGFDLGWQDVYAPRSASDLDGFIEYLYGAENPVLKEAVEKKEMEMRVRADDRMKEIEAQYENTIKGVTEKFSAQVAELKAQLMIQLQEPQGPQQAVKGIDLGVAEAQAKKGKDLEDKIHKIQQDGYERIKKLKLEMKERLQEQASKQRSLTNEEKWKLANSLMRGYRNAGLRIPKPGFAEARAIDFIDPNMNVFYDHSDVALLKYIDEMTQAIEIRKFFGQYAVLKDEQLDVPQSIGEVVAGLVDRGEMSRDKEAKAKYLLTSYFNPKTMGRWFSLYRNIEYIETLGHPHSAVTQLQDQAFAVGFGGPWNWLMAVAKKNKIDVLKDFHIENIVVDFINVSKSSKILDLTLRTVGLTRLDRMGKDVLVNAAWYKYQRMAKGDSKQRNILFGELQDYVGKDAALQTLRDIESGQLTDNVMLTLFNVVMDFHPIDAFELPPAVSNSGNLRIMYMLKYYQVKQLNIYRKLLNTAMKDPDPAKRLRAFKQLVAFVGGVIALGMTTDVIKDFMSGRPIRISDLVVDNILKVVGLSKYQVYQFLPRQGEKFEAVKTIGRVAFPPFRLIEGAFNDMARAVGAVKEGHEYVIHDMDIWQSVPILGKIYYWNFGGGTIKTEKSVVYLDLGTPSKEGTIAWTMAQGRAKPAQQAVWDLYMDKDSGIITNLKGMRSEFAKQQKDEPQLARRLQRSIDHLDALIRHRQVDLVKKWKGVTKQWGVIQTR